MPLLLRAIRKSRWFEQPWLKQGKAQANALWDLRPEENTLSFWHVEDNKSNLYEVVAAVAAGRDSPANFDYVLLDQTLLTKTGIEIDHTVGHSFHKEADTYWHRDTGRLSAEDVAQIANIIMQRGTRERIQKRQITSLVKRAISLGMIDAKPLIDRLKQKELRNWLN